MKDLLSRLSVSLRRSLSIPSTSCETVISSSRIGFDRISAIENFLGPRIPRMKFFPSKPTTVKHRAYKLREKFNFGSPVDIGLSLSKRAALYALVFVCLLIYLRRHARCRDARRNALASGYVPLLPRARGRTSFHSASWNVFNSSAGFFFSIYVVPALRGRPAGPTCSM